jgi:hypothetical protein
MTTVLTTIGLLAEVFTIVGLASAAFCFAILLSMIGSRGPWQKTPAAISEGRLNWMSPDGQVHSRNLSDAELAIDHDHDHLEVFHRKRRSDHAHFTAAAPDEKLVRTLGLVFAGIGLLAVVASIVVLFFE